MPKNKGKGGKNRRRGKNENEGLKRELVFKEDGQEYAQVRLKLIKPQMSKLNWELYPRGLEFLLLENLQELMIKLPISKVTKMLGNGRLEAMCFDGVKRLCHIRGKLRKKVIFKSQPSENMNFMKPAGLDQSIGHCPHRPQRLPGTFFLNEQLS